MAEGQDSAIHRVLRLVAEGQLTADEAAPILDALSRPKAPTTAADGPGAPGAVKLGSGSGAGEGSATRPRYARIQVMEGGRRAVDLRIPVGLGRFALSKVPGLSNDQINEVQDALASGTHGPILDVQDADGDGVRIVLE
ncbi:MAG TPA: hypothetical protein VKC59_02290 [Candidatus Limnocylindrales bacterium]|nr:hypothetical protein [Candidatus Limnocylindrales bacterium]